jgi:hypothetical protein
VEQHNGYHADVDDNTSAAKPMTANKAADLNGRILPFKQTPCTNIHFFWRAAGPAAKAATRCA